MDKVNAVSEFPVTVIEFLEFLYSNVKVFGNFCMEKRFLKYLAATLYPLESKDESFEVFTGVNLYFLLHLYVIYYLLLIMNALCLGPCIYDIHKVGGGGV